MMDNLVNLANPKSKPEFLEYYNRIREDTEQLARHLPVEDYMVQAMTDASPTKWHLAHVSWFFEAFILKRFDHDYIPLNEMYNYLFNSYYQDVGKPWSRPNRAHISRPTVKEVYEFRDYINKSMISLLDSTSGNSELETLTVLGGNHEQQHQELILTDIKYNLSVNPLFPEYKKLPKYQGSQEVPKLEFIPIKGGIVEIGNARNDCFVFDNESPAKKVYLVDFKIANRLVTNGEFLDFIQAGGYKDFRYWLSEGWDRIRQEGWEAPLHWHKIDGDWFTYTLSGLKKLDPREPVTHVSYFEADAYAKFKGKRLPTEEEWEHTVCILKPDPSLGNFRESGLLHPRPATFEVMEKEKVTQLFGDVWEWTASSYLPYPGFSVLAEGISEYNGKFMSSQFVLRGGSCVTPVDHIRTTYRNFWHPHIRFQFSGIRLAI